MLSLEQKMRRLPPEVRQMVEEFVEYLYAKYNRPQQGAFRFDWQGALEPLRDQYTSVQLQHEILKE